MIFVDANCYLRFLTEPVTPEDRDNQRRARALFELVTTRLVEVTTSEAVLAEVVFILTSPRHYHGERTLAAASLRSFLRQRGHRMPAKDVSLLALDVWVDHPRLSFPDALSAAYSRSRGYELATFDGLLSRTPGVTNYAFQG